MANRKENKGGNSQLDDKYWNCPDYVLNTLGNAVKMYESLKVKGGKTEGYERAKGILVEKSITYKQMKRIKNWFDSFEGKWDDTEFKLNGGKTMHNWVNGTLGNATKSIKSIKDAQKDTNPENTHIKSHEKDTTKINKDTTLRLGIPKLHKGKVSNFIFNDKAVYEGVERMKYLIIYESKI
jgi:hypothetical protein|tara:strand:+ start:1071 stop:1613 length:543 start_codon:yes stop_codon:yes gene_type:complete